MLKKNGNKFQGPNPSSRVEMTQVTRDQALASLLEFWGDMGLIDPVDAATLMRQARQGAKGPASAPPAAVLKPSASGREVPARAGDPADAPPRRLVRDPVEQARIAAAKAGTLAQLKSIVEAFEGCPLRAAATNTVVCDGVFDADVMLIGEAPGAEEDRKGLPFVGRAGKLLDRMLSTIGLSREANIYITNTVYWRPPGNRDPMAEETAICAPFLHRQIALKKPKLILTAGKFATQALLNTDDGIMRLRGRRMAYSQTDLAPIPCVPTLHPAYLLRRPQDKARAWADLLTIASLCDELGIKRSPAL